MFFPEAAGGELYKLPGEDVSHWKAGLKATQSVVEAGRAEGQAFVPWC
jgi:hypothetical protein